jgi:hypothetical protein
MLFYLRRQGAGLSNYTLSSSRGSKVGHYQPWSPRPDQYEGEGTDHSGSAC